MDKDFVRKFPSYTSCTSLLAKPLYASYKTTKKQNASENVCLKNTYEENEFEKENNASVIEVKYDRKNGKENCRNQTYCISDVKSSEPIVQCDIPGVCDRTVRQNKRKVEFDTSNISSSDDYKKRKCFEKPKKDTELSIEFSSGGLGKDLYRKVNSQGSALKVCYESKNRSLEKVSVENRRDEIINSEELYKTIPAPCLHWLRVLPNQNKESCGVYDTFLTWILSQVGVAVLLIAWSTIWVTVLYLTEGSSEYENAAELMRKQNDLVIELATELRQINPLSLSWVSAISRHVATARALGTFERYFDLPGCMLFAVNILTALGFGAPVPHSVAGQVATFIFAVMGFPAHVYLVINAGTALSEILKKADSTKKTLRDKKHLLSLLQSRRCFPMILVVYYMIGAAAFGVMRSRSALDAVMFPLEFTTSGGLHDVSGAVRILYAIYLESMVLLVGCTAAVLRSAVANVFSNFAAKRHVFVYAN